MASYWSKGPLRFLINVLLQGWCGQWSDVSDFYCPTLQPAVAFCMPWAVFFLKLHKKWSWLLCLHPCWAFLPSVPFCLLHTLLDLGTPDVVQKRWLGCSIAPWQLISVLYKSSAGVYDIIQGWILLVSHFGFLVLEENRSSKNFSWFTVQTNKSIGFEFHVTLGDIIKESDLGGIFLPFSFWVVAFIILKLFCGCTCTSMPSFHRELPCMKFLALTSCH